MIHVPEQPKPEDRIPKDIKFSNGDTLNLMTQIIDGSQIVEEDGSTGWKGKKYEVSRAMGCIYKIEIVDPRDPKWTE